MFYMKKELQEKLFIKYPKIFRQKDLSSQETCMSWGITCGDGWYILIDTLCEAIQQRVQFINGQKILVKSDIVRLVPVEQPSKMICEAVQVKQKYGGLRFYTEGEDDFIRGLISMAESMSYTVCETCGKSGKPTKTRWVKTLCQECEEKRYICNPEI